MLPPPLQRITADLLVLVLVVGLGLGAGPGPMAAQALASPGLCVGPVCGDTISRSAKHHWQLRLRLSDGRGQQERVVVDCRDGRLSPLYGPVERGYAAAVARRVCRLAGEPAA